MFFANWNLSQRVFVRAIFSAAAAMAGKLTRLKSLQRARSRAAPNEMPSLRISTLYRRSGARRRHGLKECRTSNLDVLPAPAMP